MFIIVFRCLENIVNNFYQPEIWIIIALKPNFSQILASTSFFMFIIIVCSGEKVWRSARGAPLCVLPTGCVTCEWRHSDVTAVRCSSRDVMACAQATPTSSARIQSLHRRAYSTPKQIRKTLTCKTADFGSPSIVPKHYYDRWTETTGLCPHRIGPTHDWAHAWLWPHTIGPTQDCDHTRLWLHDWDHRIGTTGLGPHDWDHRIGTTGLGPQNWDHLFIPIIKTLVY